jgi:regulator of replication initiation timing
MSINNTIEILQRQIQDMVEENAELTTRLENMREHLKTVQKENGELRSMAAPTPMQEPTDWQVSRPFNPSPDVSTFIAAKE